MPEKYMGIVGEVEFTIALDDQRRAELHRHAAELDEGLDDDEAPEYTDLQAFQIVWHLDPAWLSAKRILIGWTLEKAGLDGAEVRPVWEG